jgi:hypothetical protein
MLAVEQAEDLGPHRVDHLDLGSGREDDQSALVPDLPKGGVGVPSRIRITHHWVLSS